MKTSRPEVQRAGPQEQHSLSRSSEYNRVGLLDAEKNLWTLSHGAGYSQQPLEAHDS